MTYITQYNDEWPKRFEQIVGFLRDKLPEKCSIHHVGSTSIPGMPAKDIIDVDIECPNGTTSSIVNVLGMNSYIHEGNKGIPSREAFHPEARSPASELPHHHLYACDSRSPELYKHLAFRDYLLSHEQRAKWLAMQKIVIDRSAESRDAYIEGKGDVYNVITREALSWAIHRLDQIVG